VQDGKFEKQALNESQCELDYEKYKQFLDTSADRM
jgi:hypothetical protein